VVKALVDAGFTVVGRKGSHIRLKRRDGETRVVVVPDHRELAKGTLIHTEAGGLSREEFLKLLT
jgi:predicted RNA binding protein YcfA (HicA-like mRNA interferase family)